MYNPNKHNQYSNKKKRCESVKNILIFQATLLRLKSLRITTSHAYMYKKLDEFGVNHDSHIPKAVEDESQRLASTMPESEAEKSGKLQESSSIDDNRLKTLSRKVMFVNDSDDDADDEFLQRINKKLGNIAERRQEKAMQ